MHRSALTSDRLTALDHPPSASRLNPNSPALVSLSFPGVPWSLFECFVYFVVYLTSLS